MITNFLPRLAAAGRRWRPAAPAVPPLLWATGAAVGLAVLNLVFWGEIWSAGTGGKGSWLALLALAVLAGAQAVPVLWRWPPPPLAPRWGKRLWCLATGAAGFALGVGVLVAGVATLVLAFIAATGILVRE